MAQRRYALSGSPDCTTTKAAYLVDWGVVFVRVGMLPMLAFHICLLLPESSDRNSTRLATLESAGQQ